MKLPVVSAKDAIKALEKDGFAFVRQKGSHLKLRKENAGVSTTVIVPDHKTLKPGTLRAIIRQSGLDLKTFLELL